VACKSSRRGSLSRKSTISAGPSALRYTTLRASAPIHSARTNSTAAGPATPHIFAPATTPSSLSTLPFPSVLRGLSPDRLGANLFPNRCFQQLLHAYDFQQSPTQTPCDRWDNRN